MFITDKNRVALSKCKTIDEAAQYTALHMGVDDECEIAKLILLSRHNAPYNKTDFAEAMARVAPLKTESIAINQSRYERLIKSSNNDEFVANFATCLRAIEYDCSQSSVIKLIEQFFNRDLHPRNKTDSWYFDSYLKFTQNQGADNA